MEIFSAPGLKADPHWEICLYVTGEQTPWTHSSPLKLCPLFSNKCKEEMIKICLVARLLTSVTHSLTI